ncbi:uncharacterized protein LOC111619558 [Centruroides sculpturatus]|uniref:uncharacterized protein LOC111619558 n=1 Tax=Centruroides sculpturatus TaxID=218467 RepID=UPI000C6E15E3|nr:uncharacterized protein LOC111619558 [Centruroides sculpturatus]
METFDEDSLNKCLNEKVNQKSEHLVKFNVPSSRGKIRNSAADCENSESFSLTSSLEFLEKELNLDADRLHFSPKTRKLKENNFEISDNSKISNLMMIKNIGSCLLNNNLDDKTNQKLLQELLLVLKKLLCEENEKGGVKRNKHLPDSEITKKEKHYSMPSSNKDIIMEFNPINEYTSSLKEQGWNDCSYDDSINVIPTTDTLRSFQNVNKINVEKPNIFKRRKPKLPPKVPLERKYNVNNSTSSSEEHLQNTVDDIVKRKEAMFQKSSKLSVLPLSKHSTPFYRIGENILKISNETVPSIYGTKSKNIPSVTIKIEPADSEKCQQSTKFEVSQISPEEKALNLVSSSIKDLLKPVSRKDTNIVLMPSPNDESAQDTEIFPVTAGRQSSVIFPIDKILDLSKNRKKPTVVAIPATEVQQNQQILDNDTTVLIAPPPKEFQRLTIEDPTQKKWSKIAEKIAESLSPSEQPMVIILPPDAKYLDEESDDNCTNLQSLIFMSPSLEMIQPGETIDEFSYNHRISEIPTVVVVPSKSQHTFVKIDTEKIKVPMIQKNPFDAVTFTDYISQKSEEFSVGTKHYKDDRSQKSQRFSVGTKHHKDHRSQKSQEHPVSDDERSKKQSEMKEETENVSIITPTAEENPGNPLSASMKFDSTGLPPLKIEIGRKLKAKKRVEMPVNFKENTTYGEKMTELYKWQMALAVIEEGIEESFVDCLMVGLNQLKDKKHKLVERRVIKN